MANGLVCWKCGASVDDIPLPFRRLERCPACEADLHVCRLCTHYDPRITGACREDDADDVAEKERANFCDYYEPKPNAYVARDQERDKAARAELYALFGMTPETDGTEDSPGSDKGTDAKHARHKIDGVFPPKDERKDKGDNPGD